MRTFLTSLGFLFIFSLISSGQEDFKVIKVNGSIVMKTNNVSLQTGTVFSDKETLVFGTDDATAAVINEQKGRMILTSKSHDLSAARSNYLPAMYNISTRGGSLSNLIDLQNHFSGKYVVLDRSEIVLDEMSFPMDKDNFFFLRYTFKSEEINKKLEFNADTLIIDKKSLYTIDGKPIPRPDNTVIKLFYRNGDKSVQINEFNLIFPDTKQLKEELKIILETMKDRSPKEQIGEINAYLYEEYGKVYQPNLTSWLENNLGLAMIK
ncbi:MAG: hypothetical protein NT092_11700 [Bacteroidia bacterium]|nr:hypothetical protein [Bacteroidia bacterium]